MTDVPTWALWALVPLLGAALTSYLKFSVVLSLVRNSLGTPEFLSSAIITGLAIVFSLVVMAPVADATWQAWRAHAQPEATPRSHAKSASDQVVAVAPEVAAPLIQFWRKHSGATEVALFLQLATDAGHPSTANDFRVAAPAFVATELREALELAILLMIPFLLIDVLVGTSLASLGLSSISTQSIALPIKLLLFLAVGGIALVAEAITRSYV